MRVSLCIFTQRYFSTDLHTSVLNYTVISGDKRARNVTIQWATPDGAIADIEYVLSMTNYSDSQSWTIRATHLNLTLQYGIHYDFTVTSQRCAGNLTSKSSRPLRVFFAGIGFNGYLHVHKYCSPRMLKYIGRQWIHSLHHDLLYHSNSG